MHEIHVAHRIAQIAASRVPADRNRRDVKAVRVRIGAWTCIDPESLRRAFATAAEEQGLGAPALDIVTVQPDCRCEDCGAVFEGQGEFKLRCAKCGSAKVTMAQGEDMAVQDIVTGPA